MIVVFEVHLPASADSSTLLSAEVVRETKAQVMTLAEAAQVGFQGLGAEPPGMQTRLVAVAPRDAQWVHRVLETHEAVAGFRRHDVDL
jgi:hypothetical protein